MNWLKILPVATLFVVSLVPSARPLNAQVGIDADPGSSIRTRQDLETLLSGYEQALLSPAYSSGVKRDIQVRIGRIRDRLENGDFKLGDRVVLSVEGEPDLPDTLAVQSSPAGPRITLPLFGDIPLAGVLRSEIETRIAEVLGRFINNPIVRAEGLMRVSVQGAVRTPGFYLVPADMLLSEALMVAGGPDASSDLSDLRIERGQEVIFSGAQLQEELRQGRTLDQLNLQAGDQLVVPQQGGGFFASFGLISGLVTSVLFVTIQLLR